MGDASQQRGPYRRAPVRFEGPAEALTAAADQPRFARFAAAMDAARDARAPQFALYEQTPAAVDAPAVGRGVPWQVLRRPRVRRLALGGGVALVALLLVTALSAPIGAALGWLTGPAPESAQEQAAAAAPAAAVPVTPEPAAGPDDPPPLTRSPPVLAADAFQAASQKIAAAPEGRATRVTALDATARPLARSLPVPSFKPSSADP